MRKRRGVGLRLHDVEEELVGCQVLRELAHDVRVAFHLDVLGLRILVAVEDAVFDLVKDINTLSATSSKEALETAAAAFDEITGVLGLLYNRKKDEVPAEVTALVEKRAAAKKAKDWATADAIRAELTAMGWAVKDTAQGPQLSKL